MSTLTFTTSTLSTLATDRLLTELADSVANENRHLARTILLLAEVSNRRVHLDLGFPSLFEFCKQKLCLSEGSIYRRIQVARAVRRYPLLHQLIHDSQLTLTTASLLCPHLKGEDQDQFIHQFVGKTKTQAQELLASLGKANPTPKPDSIRRVADRFVLQARTQTPQSKACELNLAHSHGKETLRPCPDQTPTDKQPAPVVRESCFQVSFVAGESLRDKIECLRERLSNKYPGGKLEHMLEEVITYYLNATLPKPKRDRAEEAPAAKRYISRDLKAQLMQRSKSRCEWVGLNGRRCSARKFLHIDHILALSLGGRTELANLQVLCSAHNHLKARRDHGERFVAGKIATGVRS